MIHPTPRNIGLARPGGSAGPRRSLPAVLVLAILVAPGMLLAEDETLPKAEVILDKFVEATGGKVAYQKLTNRVTKITVEQPSAGMKMTVTTYEAKPDKTYTLIESNAVGSMERGISGGVAWEKSLMMGPQIKTGEEKALMLRTSAFNAVVDWRKLYTKAECVGVETVEGEACYKVVLSASEGPPETRYYNKQSNLLAKTELDLELPMGTISLALFYGDYKPVDGVLYAHKVRRVGAGPEILIVTESIEHNVEMPADRFKLPEEIQALLEKKKGEKPKATEP